MARLFNGATDQVSYGSAASIDDMDPFTLFFVFRASTLDTTFRYLVRKQPLNLSLHDSIIECERGYATTSLSAVSSTTISTGIWYALFVVNGGAGVAPHLYLATLGGALAEVSYTTQTTPVGTITTDAANSFVVGFRDATRRFVGDIALAVAWEEVLSIDACRRMLYRPSNTATSRLLSNLGWGTTDIDMSGLANNGTPTATTVSNHPPFLGAQFGMSEMRPYVVSAAASAIPRFWAQYRRRHAG